MTEAEAGWSELARHVSGARARLAAAAQSPRASQEALLQAILTRHAGCAFGQRHGFARLRTLADYQRAVPAAGHDAFASEIDAMARGEPSRLVDEPVLAFERTGGSGGGAKLIPLTASGLAALQQGLFAWMDDWCHAHPRLLAGSSYWSISPATRAPEVTPGGTPIGLASDAAYFGPAAEALMRVLCVLPAVGAITDVATWRTLTLQALLADERLALVSVWSPTFWLELCRHLRLEQDALLAALAEGRWAAPVPAALQAHLPPPAASPGRAARLAEALSRPEPDWSAVWPGLALLSCWTHASAEPWAAQLAAAFPQVTVQGKGLLATEGLVSLPLAGAGDGDGDPVAAITSTVLEFEDAAGHAHACDEVQTGAEYTVLLTTSAGLYRYRLGDRVRVTGWWHGAPRLRLLGRDTASSDLCGEKLTEAFVMRCRAEAGLGRDAAGIGTTGMRLVPRLAPGPHYELVLDRAEHGHDDDAGAGEARATRIAGRLDHALRANPQYAYARDLGQLGPLAVRLVDHLAARLQAQALAQGQRLGDAKPTVLGRLGEAEL